MFTQVFFDFDEVRGEIEQETDKEAGQNKVYILYNNNCSMSYQWTHVTQRALLLLAFT